MSVKNMVLPIPLTFFDATDFNGTYQLLSAFNGIPYACIMIRIVNNSDQDVAVSYDGITTHDFVPTLSSLNLQFQTNSQPQNSVCSLSQGTKIWILANAAGTGVVYLAGFYQPQA
jgi:hypothetical protein